MHHKNNTVTVTQLSKKIWLKWIMERVTWWVSISSSPSFYGHWGGCPSKGSGPCFGLCWSSGLLGHSPQAKDPLGGFSSPQQINRLGQQISQDFYTLGWAYEFSCFFSVDITVICGRLSYATLWNLRSK